MCIRTFFWCLKSFISKEKGNTTQKKRDNSKQGLFGNSRVRMRKEPKIAWKAWLNIGRASAYKFRLYSHQ